MLKEKIIKYIIYALEEYKKFYKIKGKEASIFFSENNIYDFIIENYEALHTGSSENLIKDIEEYVKK